MTWRTSSNAKRRPGGTFNAIDAELDPGICDKLPLIEGFTTETVEARRTGA